MTHNPNTDEPVDIIADSAFDTDMVFYHATLDDEQAADLLLYNKEPEKDQQATNRKASPTKIAEYAAAMVAGEWYLSPQPIVLSMPVKDGQKPRLLDGQQRLKALRLASKDKPGIRIPFTICFNAPDESGYVLDIGKPRQPGDWLAMSGHSHPAALSRAVKMLYAVEEMQPFQSISLWRSAKLLPNRQASFLAKHMGVKHGLFEARNTRSLVMPHVGATLWYLMNREYGPFITAKFFHGLATGADLSTDDARLNVREFLATQKVDKYKWDGFEQLAVLIAAANAWAIDSKTFSAKRAFSKTGKRFPELIAKAKLPKTFIVPANDPKVG